MDGTPTPCYGPPIRLMSITIGVGAGDTKSHYLGESPHRLFVSHGQSQLGTVLIGAVEDTTLTFIKAGCPCNLRVRYDRIQ